MDYHSYLIAFITIFALLALVFWRARKFSKSFSQQSPSELLPDSEEELNLSLNEEEQELIQNIRDFQDSIDDLLH